MKKIFSIMLTLCLAMTSQAQSVKKPWAVLCSGTLTFSYGIKAENPQQIYCQKCDRQMSFSSNFCSNCGWKNPKTVTTFEVPLASQKFDPVMLGEKEKEDPEKKVPWQSRMNEVKSVVFNSSFRQVTTITSTSCWFECDNEKSKLQEIKGIQNLNTSNVKYMKSMFQGCSKLKRLDLSSFDTRKVRDTGGMFLQCSSLVSLNISSFNTSNVISTPLMFGFCSSLTTIDVSRFKTDKVTDMIAMFIGCKKLSTLDLTSFNTSQTKQMNLMFAECKNLKTVYVSSKGWNLNRAKATEVEVILLADGYGTDDMFSECPAKVIKR